MRTRNAALCAILLGPLVVTGCASDPRSGTPELTISPNCSTQVIIDWDSSPGEATPAAAIQSRMDWYASSLNDLPDDVRGGDLTLPLEYDPIRLRIAIDGMSATLARVDEAVRNTPAENDTIVVSGERDGVPISELEVGRRGDGTYKVDKITVFGFTSDDPVCLPGSTE